MKLLLAARGGRLWTKKTPASSSLIDAAHEIVPLSLAPPGRLDWLTSATDKARERADERLQTVLGQLDELGASAEGSVGADDPLLAFEDAVREFAPDHLLIGLRAEDRSGWQEKGLLDQVQQRFALPTTVFQFSDN